MHNNPLICPILSLLRASPAGLSELELIKRLQQRDAAFAGKGTAPGADLALFRKHFLVMNALYQLQGLLREEGLALRIDPLLIVLVSGEECNGPGGGELAGGEALRRYYLDWDNLHQTSASDVAALLQGFWDRYHAVDRQAEALALLGLAGCEAITWASIQRRYRQLITRHHPDKGGEPGRFIEIREAYELLRRLHARD
ncbi:DNA-J related domain-containing protein [Sedimenticola hydrogenitrophicus]|uniref:DNA-J related domain-containing protein n=1 Tax=Sedimenticola hydrogenitrophicus TaxID=2967975 RepID=UPI0023AF98F3|nr:DNA-J related domain-containing protein [Sedimenticola hydrogenitrophicus]